MYHKKAQRGRNSVLSFDPATCSHFSNAIQLALATIAISATVRHGYPQQNPG